MLYSSTVLKYPVLTLLSRGKRSFENMGLLIQRSGDTVKRLLHPAAHSFNVSRSICQSMFAKNEILCVGIDDTLLRKIYSRFMQVLECSLYEFNWSQYHGLQVGQWHNHRW